MTVRPLAGISVLDLTTFLSGPYAVMTLGQLGASVVKVEPPTGDPTRAGRVEPDSDFWFALHRGRKSVVLDLKNDDARAQLLQLVQRSDVVVDKARAGGRSQEPRSISVIGDYFRTKWFKTPEGQRQTASAGLEGLATFLTNLSRRSEEHTSELQSL